MRRNVFPGTEISLVDWHNFARLVRKLSVYTLQNLGHVGKLSPLSGITLLHMNRRKIFDLLKCLLPYAFGIGSTSNSFCSIRIIIEILFYFCSTWGETSFMSVQTVILIILCYYYNGIISGVVIFPPLYALFVYVLTCGVVPIELHTKMQVGILPIISFSKVSN